MTLKKGVIVLAGLLFLMCYCVIYGDAISKQTDTEKVAKRYKLLMLKAKVYEDSRDYENADNLYESMKKEFQDDTSQIDIGFKKGLNHYTKAKYNKVIEEYEELIKKYDKQLTKTGLRERCNVYLGYSYAISGKYDKSEEIFNKMLKESEEKNYGIISSIGEICYLKQDYNKSIEKHNESIELFKKIMIGKNDEHDFVLYEMYYISMCYKAIDNYQKEIETYKYMIKNIKSAKSINIKLIISIALLDYPETYNDGILILQELLNNNGIEYSEEFNVIVHNLIRNYYIRNNYNNVILLEKDLCRANRKTDYYYKSLYLIANAYLKQGYTKKSEDLLNKIINESSDLVMVKQCLSKIDEIKKISIIEEYDLIDR